MVTCLTDMFCSNRAISGLPISGLCKTPTCLQVHGIHTQGQPNLHRNQAPAEGRCLEEMGSESGVTLDSLRAGNDVRRDPSQGKRFMSSLDWTATPASLSSAE